MITKARKTYVKSVISSRLLFFLKQQTTVEVAHNEKASKNYDVQNEGISTNKGALSIL